MSASQAEDTLALTGLSDADEERPVPHGAQLQGLKLLVSFGADKGKTVTCTGPRLGIGTARGNDLMLSDSTVSRRHCELIAAPTGVLLRDLDSTNGTRLGGSRIESAYVGPGATIHVGSTTLRLESADQSDMSARGQSSTLPHKRVLWKSASMARIFSVLARVSRYDSTVLLKGETGTGKSLLARTIHRASARGKGPFVVVDCGAIPPTLIESELFGHEKGAFTGAQNTHIGSFEAARGGTIFLDEIGELPLDMQPKLLRALEDRVVKRIGSTHPVALDVRVIAATNRDLTEAVENRTFRLDLLYRLNTVTVLIPPLRDRPEDIGVLAAQFYRECVGDPEAMLSAAMLEELEKYPWPGNARELRSAVERMMVLGDPWPDAETPAPLMRTQRISLPAPESLLTFREAKERAIAAWEQHYVEALLQRTNGNLSQAAREVKMDRNYLRELVRRRGVGESLTAAPAGRPRLT